MKKKTIFTVLLILTILFINIFTLSACNNNHETTTNYKHAFSVGDNKQVYFAKSNLQYNASTNTWSFANNAYDFIGQDNENIDKDYNGNIDLIAWGATGANGVYPYSIETDNTTYGDGHKSIANTEMDFSVAIANQLGSDYRMFTHDEIHYLLMFRTNADKLFGYGTINNLKGLFILPDDWSTPNEIQFTPSPSYGFTNQYNWYWSIGDNDNYLYNNYSIDEWNIMESSGAVFLPAAGMRYEKEVSHINISGHYWTSSEYGEEFANCLCLFEKDLFLEGNFDRSYGLAIRLIKDVK